VIRAAVAADTAAVLALWDSARSGVASTTDDAEVIARLLEADRGALLVAEQGGRVVGSLIAAWDGWRGNMYRLAVAPGLRRGGIARELVAAGERRLGEKGCFRITALVWGEDDVALGFWDAAGYGHDPRIHRYVKTIPCAR
jgi:ribosomal protein S18 acetylase RimI-like enzyme